MSGIYIITNLVNGKTYIGKSNNIKRRFSEHRNLNKESNKSLLFAYKKYGIENFSFDVLEICDISELNEREMFWIEKLNPEYNRTRGGDGNFGRILSDESKEKLRRAGKRIWESKTEEEKAAFKRTNLSGPKQGHAVSKATREKLRNANIGKKQSKETIRKRIESLKSYKRTNEGHKKPVICIETGEVFESCKDASEKYGLSTLCGHLKGKYKTCKGKHYRYL